MVVHWELGHVCLQAGIDPEPTCRVAFWSKGAGCRLYVVMSCDWIAIMPLGCVSICHFVTSSYLRCGV